MVPLCSKVCRAKYRFSLSHFTLLPFYVSVGSAEENFLEQCIFITALSSSDGLSICLCYCSYCSLGKGAVKPSEALRAAAEHESQYEHLWLWGWPSRQ